MVQLSSFAANSFRDMTSRNESRRHGWHRKNPERSNEFTDFQNFKVEEVTRQKTMLAMKPANYLGIRITLETTARDNMKAGRHKALKSRQRAIFMNLEG